MDGALGATADFLAQVRQGEMPSSGPPFPPAFPGFHRAVRLMPAFLLCVRSPVVAVGVQPCLPGARAPAPPRPPPLPEGVFHPDLYPRLNRISHDSVSAAALVRMGFPAPRAPSRFLQATPVAKFRKSAAALVAAAERTAAWVSQKREGADFSPKVRGRDSTP